MARRVISDLSQETRDIINDIIAAIAALTAKLDADAGVTDADYAATVDIGDTVERN